MTPHTPPAPAPPASPRRRPTGRPRHLRLLRAEDPPPAPSGAGSPATRALAPTAPAPHADRHATPTGDDAWAAGIRRVAAMAARAAGELGAVIAPPGCVACRAPTGGPQERLCAACLRALPWLRPGCARCALPTHRGRPCPASGAASARAWAPLAYEGVARDLVGALKFGGALPVADVMAAHMAANLPPGLRAATAAIVPVPCASTRSRRRGFDPAGVLATAFARRLDRPLVPCLERRDRGGRQVGAGRAARRAPGRIAVAVRSPPPPAVFLVDDVHTTGATLDACARALTAAGSTVVAAVTYARTL